MSARNRCECTMSKWPSRSRRTSRPSASGSKWPRALQQVHGNARLAKHRHQLAFAAQHRGFDVERLAVGVGQQRQEVVFGAAAFERRDQLQHPNRPPRTRLPSSASTASTFSSIRAAGKRTRRCPWWCRSDRHRTLPMRSEPAGWRAPDRPGARLPRRRGTGRWDRRVTEILRCWLCRNRTRCCPRSR